MEKDWTGNGVMGSCDREERARAGNDSMSFWSTSSADPRQTRDAMQGPRASWASHALNAPWLPSPMGESEHTSSVCLVTPLL